MADGLMNVIIISVALLASALAVGLALYQRSAAARRRRSMAAQQAFLDNTSFLPTQTMTFAEALDGGVDMQPRDAPEQLENQLEHPGTAALGAAGETVSSLQPDGSDNKSSAWREVRAHMRVRIRAEEGGTPQFRTLNVIAIGLEASERVVIASDDDSGTAESIAMRRIEAGVDISACRRVDDVWTFLESGESSVAPLRVPAPSF